MIKKNKEIAEDLNIDYVFALNQIGRKEKWNLYNQRPVQQWLLFVTDGPCFEICKSSVLTDA